MLIREGKELFCEKRNCFREDRQFSSLRYKEMSFNADDVAEIEFFFDEFQCVELFRRRESFHGRKIPIEHHLHAARFILHLGKGILPHGAEQDETP